MEFGVKGAFKNYVDNPGGRGWVNEISKLFDKTYKVKQSTRAHCSKTIGKGGQKSNFF